MLVDFGEKFIFKRLLRKHQIEGPSALVIGGICDPATLRPLHAVRQLLWHLQLQRFVEAIALAEDLQLQRFVVASDCKQVIVDTSQPAWRHAAPHRYSTCMYILLLKGYIIIIMSATSCKMKSMHCRFFLPRLNIRPRAFINVSSHINGWACQKKTPNGKQEIK